MPCLANRHVHDKPAEWDWYARTRWHTGHNTGEHWAPVFIKRGFVSRVALWFMSRFRSVLAWSVVDGKDRWHQWFVTLPLLRQICKFWIDNGNLLASKYVVGCQPGYSPNMEGQFQSSIVECAVKPSDPKFVGWNFKNSFDCVKTSVDIEFSQNKNGSPPPCNLDGVDWVQSENYVRKDATSSATWPILMDSNGAFIRTRVPVPASMIGITNNLKETRTKLSYSNILLIPMIGRRKWIWKWIYYFGRIQLKTFGLRQCRWNSAIYYVRTRLQTCRHWRGRWINNCGIPIVNGSSMHAKLCGFV